MIHLLSGGQMTKCCASVLIMFVVTFYYILCSYKGIYGEIKAQKEEMIQGTFYSKILSVFFLVVVVCLFVCLHALFFERIYSKGFYLTIRKNNVNG